MDPHTPDKVSLDLIQEGQADFSVDERAYGTSVCLGRKPASTKLES